VKVEVSGIVKNFRDAAGAIVTALDGVDLTIPTGAFVSLVGPNGCGKTTLLNIIAGLLSPDVGAVSIEGKPPAEARIGFVFQDSGRSLFPWLRNIDNIALALHDSGLSRASRRRRASRFLDEMGLSELPRDRYPYQCSGGQQQLVALARELIYEPDVLLMDEPFAALDFERRVAQQLHLLALWDKAKPTVVLVSHDIEEAVFLADRVVLLSGRPAHVVEQFEVPLERPRTLDTLENPAMIDTRLRVLRAFRRVVGQ
jgi:NitT/TauT family transport system ATP-binding protein